MLDKVNLCRQRSTPLTDAELIPYLIRALYRHEIRSVMMGNSPLSVNDFLIEARRLEGIIESLDHSSGVKAAPKKLDGRSDAND